MSIKFRKEKIENAQYADSVEIRWWFDAGSKHLPAVYAIKEGYSWEVYDAEDNCYSRHLDYYSRLCSKAEAVAFIEGYDAQKDLEIAEEQAEKAAQEAEWQNRVVREQELIESMMKPSLPVSINVGDMIQVQMSQFSKVSNIGEALANLGNRESAKVVKILEVSPERYAEFCRNSLGSDHDFDFLMHDDSSSVGGYENADPKFDGLELHEVDLDQWRIGAYALVHLVVCPGRQNLVINSEGYKYARYIGIC